MARAGPFGVFLLALCVASTLAASAIEPPSDFLESLQGFARIPEALDLEENLDTIPESRPSDLKKGQAPSESGTRKPPTALRSHPAAHSGDATKESAKASASHPATRTGHKASMVANSASRSLDGPSDLTGAPTPKHRGNADAEGKASCMDESGGDNCSTKELTDEATVDHITTVGHRQVEQTVITKTKYSQTTHKEHLSIRSVKPHGLHEFGSTDGPDYVDETDGNAKAHAPDTDRADYGGDGLFLDPTEHHNRLETQFMPHEGGVYNETAGQWENGSSQMTREADRLASHGARVVHADDGGEEDSSVTLNDDFRVPEPAQGHPQAGFCKRCNGRGTCTEDGGCECLHNFSGDHCENNPCPNNCSDNGDCDETSGVCKCISGFQGRDCSEPSCKNNCSGHGECHNGTCTCRESHVGDDCSTLQCGTGDGPSCNGHGTCQSATGVCLCVPGFDGHSCEFDTSMCPSSCSGQGICVDFKCRCYDGWKGLACDVSTCPNSCSGNGVCTNSTCQCKKGFTGADCRNYPGCLNGCSGNGICEDGKVCHCRFPYTGEACSTFAIEADDSKCSNDCNDAGVCHKNKCYCHEGFGGDTCDIQDSGSRSDCLKCRGACVHGKCLCDSVSGGAGCWTFQDNTHCLNNCSNNGVCADQRCHCNEGFGFSDCAVQGEESTCSTNCNGHGACVRDTCACSPGFGGMQCDVKSDGSECNGPCNGACVKGRCVCGANAAGEYCTEEALPVQAEECTPHCSANGRCVDARCQCEPGFSGSTCLTNEKGAPQCPNKCSLQGTCHDGNCTCNEGFAGSDCSFVLSNIPCNDKCFTGICLEGFCVSTQADPVDTELLLSNSCHNNCSDHGTCIGGACVCHPSYSGTECEISSDGSSCVNDCNNKGACVNSACVCQSGYTGADCQTLAGLSKDAQPMDRATNQTATASPRSSSLRHACKGDCNSPHGECLQGLCVCALDYGGADCKVQVDGTTCKPSCADTGVCSKGKCACQEGFFGDSCAQSHEDEEDRQDASACKHDCFHQGVCVRGNCECATGFAGEFCEIVPDDSSCAVACGTNGVCLASSCVCQTGYAGPSCSVTEDGSLCPASCNWNGVCRRGTCICKPGYGGPTCEVETGCTLTCLNRGACQLKRALAKGEEPTAVDMACTCAPGFGGTGCSKASDGTTCPEECSGRGACVQGQCVCSPGVGGSKCTVLAWGSAPCPNDCSGGGVCRNGECVCNAGHGGEDCSDVSTDVGSAECPDNCHGRGACVQGTCKCSPGASGPTCQFCGVAPSQVQCSEHGNCMDGECLCDDGFRGPDCSKKACRLKCEGRGVCLDDGTCRCFEGYTGESCSFKTCPNNCNNNGFCFTGRCLCFSHWKGDDCSIPPVQTVSKVGSGPVVDTNSALNEKSSAQEHNLVIHCPEGFGGPSCSLKADGSVCARPCSHGVCVKSNCQCSDGYGGFTCKARGDGSCSRECPGFTVCQKGSCSCAGDGQGDTGGLHCDVEPDDSSCSSSCQGICRRGQCFCYPGGDLCQNPHVTTEVNMDCKTHNYCSGHGICIAGACNCAIGFTGADCQERNCQALNDCNGHGACQNGHCFCDKSWLGPDCLYSMCPNGCGPGTCRDGSCDCPDGWTGASCETSGCHDRFCTAADVMCHPESGKPASCKCAPGTNGTCSLHPRENTHEEENLLEAVNNGQSRNCVHGERDGSDCICNEGWEGDSCTLAVCLLHCLNGGHCDSSKGECECTAKWWGDECKFPACPDGCFAGNGNGECQQDGSCQCAPGFLPPNCEISTCPNGCSDNGHCVEKPPARAECRCIHGFKGDDCSEPACPDDCSGHGTCDNGECRCEPSYTLKDNCSEHACPNACNGNGECVQGVCVCAKVGDTQYSGEDCLETACPNDCSDHGSCLEGICECTPPWTGGSDCSFKECLNDCTDQGQCEDGACFCNEGFTGEDCGRRECPHECSDNGMCTNGVCDCNPGYFGLDCSMVAGCSPQCYHGGHCENFKCHCMAGRYGAECEYVSCPNDCTGTKNGVCLGNGICKCHSQFVGDDCSIPQCIGHCSRRGECTANGCVCNKGFHGDACELFYCHENCDQNGWCNSGDGVCQCYPGFFGAGCQDRCTKDCGSHGICVSNPDHHSLQHCDCETGWGGLVCDVVAEKVTCDEECMGVCQRRLCKLDGMQECFETCGKQCLKRCNMRILPEFMNRGLSKVELATAEATAVGPSPLQRLKNTIRDARFRSIDEQKDDQIKGKLDLARTRLSRMSLQKDAPPSTGGDLDMVQQLEKMQKEDEDRRKATERESKKFSLDQSQASGAFVSIAAQKTGKEVEDLGVAIVGAKDATERLDDAAEAIEAFGP